MVAKVIPTCIISSVKQSPVIVIVPNLPDFVIFTVAWFGCPRLGCLHMRSSPLLLLLPSSSCCQVVRDRQGLATSLHPCICRSVCPVPNLPALDIPPQAAA